MRRWLPFLITTLLAAAPPEPFDLLEQPNQYSAGLPFVAMKACWWWTGASSPARHLGVPCADPAGRRRPVPEA